jgi:Uma2 family endonuclease
VLSPSTEAYDRGEKLAHFKRIPSLDHVVLVAHDAERLEVWTRAPTGWRLAVAETGALRLEALDVELAVAEVYRDPTR